MVFFQIWTMGKKNVAFYDEGKIAKIEYLKTINILDIRSIIKV